MDIRFLIALGRSAAAALAAFATDSRIVKTVTDILQDGLDYAELGLELDDKTLVPAMQEAKAKIDAIVAAGGVSREDLDAQLAELDSNHTTIRQQLQQLQERKAARS